jgi:hypothetical protein
MDPTHTTTTIDGIIMLQHMRDAVEVANALDDAGFETEIRHDMIDDYSDACFLAVWRHVDIDTQVLTVIQALQSPVAKAFWKEVEAIIGPFDGILDDVGFGDGAYGRKVSRVRH